MAKVVAFDHNGAKIGEYQGSWENCQLLYNRSCKATPSNIEAFGRLELYNDADLGMGVHSHLSEKETREIYADIQSELDKANLPRYGVDDSVIARLIHFTDKAFENLGMAFIAYHITERQGGAWVFE